MSAGRINNSLKYIVAQPGQHIYRHSANDIGYAGSKVPSLLTIKDALDYLFAVAYPQIRESVATVGDLPAMGNTLNDIRFVQDAGDGKLAAYSWLQKEGEASPSWQKIYDIDFGVNDVVAQVAEITQYRFVHKYGVDDIDGSGVAITGLYAGQRFYGGASANTNLTMSANAGDGVGTRTGWIQITDPFRPTDDNLTDLGDNGATKYRFRTLYLGTSNVVGTTQTTTYGHRSISDSQAGQTFSFNDLSLTTTGSYTGSSLITGTTTYSQLGINDTDADANFSFNDLSVTTTRYMQAGNIRFTGNTISSEDVNGNINLEPNGSGIVASTKNLAFTGYGQFGNLRLTGNTLQSQDTNGNINIDPNGTGVIELLANTNVTGHVSATGYGEFANIRINNNTISSRNTNGDITLSPDGTGVVKVTANFTPDGTDGTLNIGSAAHRFNTLFLDNNLSDGTLNIDITTLTSLRDINVGVTAGMAIFYDGTKWVASIPDTEIDHGTLSGLADDDHTQYLLLAGRSSGQSIVGGTGASENLTLESTANATKGSILFKDNIAPFTNASFSGSWSGTDIGDATHNIRDVHSKGEFKGLRFENFTTAGIPSASSQNVGRAIWVTDTNTFQIDVGGTWQSFVSATAYLQNGNSFSADAYLGTNDNFDLYFERNNVAKARIRSTGLELSDSDLVLNYGAAGSGADWTATLRRPSTGMTAASVVTLPSATSTLATLGLAETFSALKTFSAGLNSTFANVTSSTIPANGIYLPSANVLGLSQNSTLKWTVRSVGLFSEETSPLIGINTSDGADNGVLQIWGGGSGDIIRGAGINFFGNENAGTGKLRLYAGNVTNGEIEFYTDNSVKRAAFLKTGELDLISGQLQFPATQNPSSNANTIDDYEEGTWTPTITFGGGSTGLAYTTRDCSYQKIGNNVKVKGYILLSSVGSSTGVARLNGLPFNSANSNFGLGAFNATYFNAFSGLTNVICGYVNSNSTQIFLQTGSATGTADLAESNFTNTSQFIFEAEYLATQ